jgi:hypothetical protein
VGVAGTSAGKCTCPPGSGATAGASAGTTVAGVSVQAAGSVPAAGSLVAASSSTTTTTSTTRPPTVSASGSVTPTAVEATTTTTAPSTQVLGETLSRPSALARTGAGVGGLALLGLVLCGSGRLAVLARRILRIG